MTPWFTDTARQEALWAEQQRWLGTPFFPCAQSVGYGVDCVRLQRACFVNIGAIPDITLPAYTLDRAKHVTRSQLLHFFLTTPQLAGRFVMVPPVGRRMVGDLLGLQSGRTDHHLACVDPFENVVHAIEDHGVIRTPLDDAKLTARTLYVLRLMEVSKS